jgi:hypothetical protein
MITDKEIKQAITKVTGLAIIRNKVELSVDEIRQIIEIMPTITGDFPITSVCREDLESKGYNTKKVSNSDMESLANRMADDYCDQLFWESMDIIAGEALNFPKKKEK